MLNPSSPGFLLSPKRLKEAAASQAVRQPLYASLAILNKFFNHHACLSEATGLLSHNCCAHRPQAALQCGTLLYRSTSHWVTENLLMYAHTEQGLDVVSCKTDEHHHTCSSAHPGLSNSATLMMTNQPAHIFARRIACQMKKVQEGVGPTHKG